jgi:hypothetical protein
MLKASRFIVAGAALLLLCTFVFPLWYIGLDAPQYPEGLGLYIYIDEIGGVNKGDLGKINNLNHYIGMKQIHPESMPELQIMPWIVAALSLTGLIVAGLGRRILLFFWIILFLGTALAGFYDYYQWGYDYGHNLNQESAIIKIPDMTYQPPLIGTKQLLNFKAISLPAIGGWAANISLLTCVLVWTFEWRRARRRKKP